MPEIYNYFPIFAPSFDQRPHYNWPYDAGQKLAPCNVDSGQNMVQYNVDAVQTMAHYKVDARQKTPHFNPDAGQKKKSSKYPFKISAGSSSNTRENPLVNLVCMHVMGGGVIILCSITNPILSKGEYCNKAFPYKGPVLSQ